jgi:hypothetical protein
VRRAGLIEPWSPFWDDFYTYELGPRPDGSWAPLTSRAAAEEDLTQPWPRSNRFTCMVDPVTAAAMTGILQAG